MHDDKSRDGAADLELVRRVLQGCGDSEHEFVTRMTAVPRLLKAQNRRFGGELQDDELIDLAQDVLLVAWSKLEAFEGRSTLDTWLYRISRLEYLGAVRRRRRSANSMEGQSRLDMFPDGIDPDARSMDAALACAALEEMGPPPADIIRMKHFDHLTFAEIGARLGLCENTIKSHYYRGLCRLRESLANGQGEAA